MFLSFITIYFICYVLIKNSNNITQNGKLNFPLYLKYYARKIYWRSTSWCNLNFFYNFTEHRITDLSQNTCLYLERALCATWPIFFRQYWPFRRFSGGTKISADFVLSPPVGTGQDIRDECANPQRLTWRLDFAAELSKALKALSPPGRDSGKFEIYILHASPEKRKSLSYVDRALIRFYILTNWEKNSP